MYVPKRNSRSEFVPIRNLPYHVRIWGTPQKGQAPLVMVHGWMDVAASYQFVVDAMAQDHYVIAPDWRGYGQTPGTPGHVALGSQRSVGTHSGGTDNYFFPDYLADLDFLLDHYAPDTPVNLVGHSMGGNVVMLYAGVRPERIRRLVNLEGFGMPASVASQAPSRYAKWMDELKQLHRGELDMRAYDSLDGVVRRLTKTNPRLALDKAEWLARHWAAENTQGQWVIQGDPAHKIINAQLYRVDEVLELYRRINMPTLAVEASDNSLDAWWKGAYTLEQYHERIRIIEQLEIARIEDAGHMMHHDQPQALAALIERFIA